ncbi:hypothetical protein [Spirosoma pomorum]
MKLKQKLSDVMPYLQAISVVASIVVMFYTLRQFHLQNQERKEKELLERAKAAVS